MQDQLKTAFSSTLLSLLVEDSKRNETLTIAYLRSRYEGWILYTISRGVMSDILSLSADLHSISRLPHQDIHSLFKICSPQLQLFIDIVIDLSTGCELMYSLAKSPPSDSDATDTKEPIELSKITEEAYIKPLIDIEALEIEYFWLCSALRDNQIKAETVTCLSWQPAGNTVRCECSVGMTCANKNHCVCSSGYFNKFGRQRSLIIRKEQKLLPRDFSESQVIIECTSDCGCDKKYCQLTFFESSKVYLPALEYSLHGLRTSKCVRRGEFVLEASGDLVDKAGPNSVRLSESLYLNLADSNIKKISNKVDGNLLAVRIFNVIQGQISCRLALFALKSLQKGEEISLDYTKLKNFSP